MYKQMYNVNRNRKTIAVLLLLIFGQSIVSPTALMALTGGPSVPEVQSFEPVGTNQMVDPFSGDFNYNIPLIDVGGYPVNIAYHSGIGMDQEASWVGLGWNINVGTINRSMRGLPDDFKGDKIEKVESRKSEKTIGMTVTGDVEIFGIETKNKLNLNLSASRSVGISYNNYRGLDLSKETGLGLSGKKNGATLPFSGGVAVSSSHQDGFGFNYNVGLASKIKLGEDNRVSFGVSGVFNSRQGLIHTLSLNGGLLGYRKKEIDPITKKEVLGARGSAFGPLTYTFTNPTYVPLSTHQLANVSLGFRVKAGLTNLVVKGGVAVGGNYNQQLLLDNTDNLPAYGYMYAHERSGELEDRHLEDFNRERDGGFDYNTTTNLPLTVHTHDVYGVSGQGIGGVYRPYRSEVGHVYRTYFSNLSLGRDAGGEIAGLNLVDGGGDVMQNIVTAKSSQWQVGDGNYAAQLFNFRKKGSSSSDLDYEPWYFKAGGELTVENDPAFYVMMGEEDPVMVELDSLRTHHSAKMKLRQYTFDDNSYKVQYPHRNYRSKRVARNQDIRSLTVDETSKWGVDTAQFKGQVSSAAKGHHIGQLEVTREDGGRYVYGLPAYNILQKEVAFNASGLSGDCAEGVVTYSPGLHNSVDNKQGVNHLFQSTTTPAHAYSYLLTHILSRDYVDTDGIAGPSDGDNGSYTKFHYKKVDGSYRWRVPVEENRANYNYGNYADPNDEMGNYLYGAKEQYYLEKIETPTQVAIFHTSPRLDGLGVKGENGGVDTNEVVHKLDSIQLFSKAAYELYYGWATPIQTVHFEYNYDLCPNTPNSQAVGGGKLTLKKLWFTYGESNRGRFSPYQFGYAKQDVPNSTINAAYNPSYEMSARDRWGNYKKNQNSYNSCDPIDYGKENSDFPYSTQSKTKADLYAYAWNLSVVKLPSGAELRVKYESDDYAYVQNHQAMEMMEVVGNGDTSTPDSSDLAGSGWQELMYKDNGWQINNYLYFKLGSKIIASGDADKDWSNFRKDYFFDRGTGKYINYLYFRFLMDLDEDRRQYVQSYLEEGKHFELKSTADVGLIADSEGNYEYAYLKIKDAKVDDNDKGWGIAHPISKSTWQFNRMFLPRIANDLGDPPGTPNKNGLLDFAKQVIEEAAKVDLVEFFKGQNETQRNRKIGLKFWPEKSQIRLYCHDRMKYGGGHRVKQVSVDDSWEEGGISTLTSYGQEYSYKTEDKDGMEISSGVASYEPLVGGEENPFRQPSFLKRHQKVWVSDNHYFQEEPFGESLFPSPSVGYSKVTVESIHNDSQFKAQRTGKTVSEYYTARDFPTLPRQTNMDVVGKVIKPLSALKMRHSFISASQGYSVELNDMHGKPKASWTYAAGSEEPLNGVEYFYREKGGMLDNTVTVLEKDGSYTEKMIGVETDLVMDSRKETNKSKTFGAMVNVNGFLITALGGIVTPIIPKVRATHDRFQGVIMTKVINRHGILEKVVAHDQGASVASLNEVYDAETGQVLMTRTVNQYEDPVYQTTIPAHFAYDRMGQAYKNAGIEVGLSFTNGVASLTDADEYFVKGDHLGMESSTGVVRKAWVTHSSSTQLKVVDELGDVDFNGNYYVKILNSGRNNVASAPVMSIQSKKKPELGGVFDLDDSTEVLSASSVEYSEDWQVKRGVITEDCDERVEEVNLLDLVSLLAKKQELVNDGVGYDLSNVDGFFKIDSVSYPIEKGQLDLFPYNGAADDDYQTSTAVDPEYKGYLVKATKTSGGNISYEICGNLGQASADNVLFSIQVPYVQEANQKEVLENISEMCNFRHQPGRAPNSVESLTRGLEYPCDVDDDCLFDHLTRWNADIISQGQKYDARILFFRCAIPHGQIEGCYQDDGCGTYSEVPGNGGKCGYVVGDTINPYRLGILGNFNAKKSWAYLTARSGGKDFHNLRHDGVYSDFSPFWSPNSGNDWSKDENNWTWTEETTVIDGIGNAIEAKDPLGVHSALLYGYGDRLVTAKAGNAQYADLFFQGFEDFDFESPTCKQNYLPWNKLKIYPEITSADAHTGRFSYKLKSQKSFDFKLVEDRTDSVVANTGHPYLLEEPDFYSENLDKSAEPRDYWVSYWVKDDTWSDEYVLGGETYANQDSTEITVGGANVEAEKIYRSNGEGWIMVRKRITIPANASGTMSVYNQGKSVVFIDDIRMYPKISAMNSYVYDMQTLRLMAELDDQNFATLYEYDESGALVRVKKETERGVLTLKEHRSHTIKQTN